MHLFLSSTCLKIGEPTFGEQGHDCISLTENQKASVNEGHSEKSYHAVQSKQCHSLFCEKEKHLYDVISTTFIFSDQICTEV